MIKGIDLVVVTGLSSDMGIYIWLLSSLLVIRLDLDGMLKAPRWLFYLFFTAWHRWRLFAWYTVHRAWETVHYWERFLLIYLLTVIDRCPSY